MQKITPRKLYLVLLLALLLLTLSMPIQPSVSAHAVKADVEYWAVIVGVANYPPGVQDLDYTDDDAYDVLNVLLASTNWEADHITMLIDEDATKANIQSAITDMGTSGDDDDVFFFFFSGHGNRVFDQHPHDEDDSYDEALCQYDFQPPGPGPITDDELGVWLSALPGTPVLVAIDTCYSGGMIKAGQGQSRGLLGAGLPAPGDGFARDLDDAISGVVLTACDYDEYSWETDVLQNGLFTYYFVEGLAGAADGEGNGDGSVSMEEAFDYLYPLVVAYQIPPPEQHPQEYDNWPGEAVLTILIPPTSTPTVTTLDYTSLGASEGQPTATLDGTITHDGGEACQYRFEYGTDSGEPYASHTDWTGSINTGESFSETISGLGEETTYYFRAQAKNTAGTSSGDELSFTTPKLFSVTLGTSPDAVSLIVDGTTYPPADLPKSFSWANGSAHDCVAPSPAASSEEGIQYVFTSWSPDGDTSPSKTITVSSNATYTANYKTQHHLTVEADYGDPSGQGWYDVGNNTQIVADELISDDGTRYVFLNWIVDGDDQSGNPVSITMDAPHTAVAEYQTQYYLTVESPYGDLPSGEDWYDEGTTATTGIAEQTIIDDSDDHTRYIFLKWIVDGIDQTGNPVSITMDAPRTATTNYKTQHYLTVNSEYGDPSGEGWHDEGDTATASVTSPVGTIIRKVFTGWSGDLTATASTKTIVIDEPKTVTANWRDDYLYLYLIVVGIVVVVGGGSALVVSSRRGRKPRRYGGTF
ncbi:MAG: caspase family protein [Dehalococcoidia bacterium]